MAILSKADILGVSDIAVEKHAIPEWGGEVYIRSLMGWERDKYDQDVVGAVDRTHARAKLVAMALCDASGQSLGFTEEDTTALSNKNSKPLDQLAGAICRLSGIGVRDVKALEKNSEGQSDDSGASSQTAGASPSENSKGE